LPAVINYGMRMFEEIITKVKTTCMAGRNIVGEKNISQVLSIKVGDDLYFFSFLI
jgi:hypothetical protein